MITIHIQNTKYVVTKEFAESLHYELTYIRDKKLAFITSENYSFELSYKDSDEKISLIIFSKNVIEKIDLSRAEWLNLHAELTVKLL